MTWRSWRWLDAAALGAVVVGVTLIVGANAPLGDQDRLVNVSYDPTRELYNISCWNTVMDENQYMIQRWNEFKSA